MTRRIKTSPATSTLKKLRESGLFEPSLEKLCEWDPDWAEKYLRMSSNPWRSGILPVKMVELISLGLSAACTNLQATATRQHTRAALKAGATREEILFVLKCASLLALHSCSLGVPILLEEATRAEVKTTERIEKTASPACDQIRAIGQWNEAWDPFLKLDPVWTDQFMAAGASVYKSGVLSAKDVELLSIAFDASITHMYLPGTRRHIRAALKAGATVEEIMEVLKICVAQGIHACILSVPIIAEELKRKPTPRK